MQKHFALVVLLGVILFMPGCSANNTNGDAGLDSRDGDDSGDFDPAGEFLLVVPPDTSLCSGFRAARTWQQELEMRGRIDLNPGSIVLPRKEGSYPADFIKDVYFGLEQAALQPISDQGEFIAQYRADTRPYS
jgi:hypothetical protein